MNSQTPCPTCGCVLYQAIGPCRGLEPEKLGALIEAAKAMVRSGYESTDPVDWTFASDNLEKALLALGVPRG